MGTINETKNNHRNHLFTTDPVIRLCRRQQAFKLPTVPFTAQGIPVFEPFSIYTIMARPCPRTDDCTIANGNGYTKNRVAYFFHPVIDFYALYSLHVIIWQ